MWSLYVLRTRSGHLYTGISTDVDRRLAEHRQNGVKTARSLRGKGPLELVFRQPVGDRGRAQRLEYRVKRLPRLDKEALILGKLILDDLA